MIMISKYLPQQPLASLPLDNASRLTSDLLSIADDRLSKMISSIFTTNLLLITIFSIHKLQFKTQ